MNGKNRRVKLKFLDIETFCEHYPLLKEGRLLIRSLKARPGEGLDLSLVLPGLNPFRFNCVVTWTTEDKGPAGQAVPAAWVEIRDECDVSLRELEFALRQSEQYRTRLGLAPPELLRDDPETRVQMAIKLLSICQGQLMRRYAVDMLLASGASSLKYLRRILEDKDQPWFLRRNALMVLGQIGSRPLDSAFAERYLGDADPRLREQARKTYTQLTGTEPGSPAMRA